MRFARLSSYFARIEATPKRLEKTGILVELLRECEPGEVREVVSLALGQLRPKYDRLELDMADKLVVRAVAQAARGQVASVEEEYKSIGDLGEVAGGMIPNIKHQAPNIKYQAPSTKYQTLIEVGEVYAELVAIAKASGQGSQEQKVGQLARLLERTGGVGAKYVVRMVLGRLRLGFMDKTILDALSTMAAGDKSAREVLDRIYQVAPDVAELAYQVKKTGIAEIEGRVGIELGRPVIMALAERLPTAEEMVKRMGKVMLEPKYDGTRVQIHFKRNELKNYNNQAPSSEQIQNFKIQTMMFEDEKPTHWVRTFTRNLDESSRQFPELARIGEQIKAREVILDAEAVGYDRETHKLLPFQTTITRKRKHSVLKQAESVPLKFFVFDILYKDGESLLSTPLYKRREILAQVVERGEVLVVDEATVAERAEEIRAYHKARLEEGLEGAMIKRYDGAYVPGRQGFNWVKLKEEEGNKGKLIDTVDAVIMGYYLGRGKRASLGVGALLVGAREGEEIVTVAKIGTGLSDELLSSLAEKLDKLKMSSKDERYKVSKMLLPDRWVRPEMVVEVAADEVTKSPQHTAGYALRFPRLVGLREDKDIEGVTTRHELLTIGGLGDK